MEKVIKISILIDANIFLAYYNENDVHHKKAFKIVEDVLNRTYGVSITSDYIFDEVLGVVVRKANSEKAIEIGKHILESEITIVNINNSLFKDAWNIFQKENKNNFSFTDCTNLSLISMIKIDKIATFDQDFKKIKNINVIDS